MKLTGVALVLVIAGAAAAQGRPDSQPDSAATRVRVASGEIDGVVLPGDPPVCAWKGIPYAAPPVGPLRWRAPRPAEAWEGVRRCSKFCAAPVQPKRLRLAVPLEEDCLYLNVWAPAERRGPLKPVIVWLNGNPCWGSVTHISQDGSSLATKGVVFVSFNYRLGPLGFFLHPAFAAEAEESRSGNFGLLDQIAALQWVRDNAAAFGGDPKRVTLMSGEALGGVSPCWMLASEAAQGLFAQVISLSGTAMLPTWAPTAAEATRAAEGAAKKLGIKEGGTPEDIRAAFRDRAAAEIVKVLNPDAYVEEGTSFVPIIDGKLVKSDLEGAFKAGTCRQVPMVLGTCAGDGAALHAPLLFGVVSLEKSMRRLFGDDAPRVLALYPRHGMTPGHDILRDFRTDIAFIAPARRLARAVSATGGSVFLYHFTRVCPEMARYGKAPHAAEQQYAFGRVPTQGTEPVDQDLADIMSTALVRFAATGDPNGDRLPKWPAYTELNDTHLEFGDAVRTGTGLSKQACDLLDRYPGLGPFGRKKE